MTKLLPALLLSSALLSASALAQDAPKQATFGAITGATPNYRTLCAFAAPGGPCTPFAGVDTGGGSMSLFAGAGAAGGGWATIVAPELQYPIVSPLLALAPVNGRGGAATFASRTSDVLHADGQPDIAFPVIKSLLYDNGTRGSLDTWTAYLEADVVGAPGYNLGIEASTFSRWTPVAKHPFQLNPLGGTGVVRADCGKGDGKVFAGGTAQNCSAAFEVAYNGARFLTGLLFENSALAAGPNGLKEAIAMAPQQAIQWHNSDATPNWSITYTGSGATYQNVLQLGDTAADFSTAVVGMGLRARPSVVAGLVACNSTTEGTFDGVTDATSSAFNAGVQGGGSNHVPVYCNGSAWTVH